MENKLKIREKETIFTKIKNKIKQIFYFNKKTDSEEKVYNKVPKISEQRRIVICGEPHSGKSVLYRTLYKALPKQYMVNISACPDAEAIFSGNVDQETIQLARIKGEFTPEYIDGVKTEIDQIDTSILFCDIGGKITDENREICSKCNTAIILYKTEEALYEWRKFCEETGLEIIGELKSEINIAKDKSEIESSPNKEIIRGTIYNLKRGSEQSKIQDELIQNLCDEICKPLIEKGNMKRTGSKILAEKNNIVDMKIIAEQLETVDSTGNIIWNPQDAKRISEMIAESVHTRKDVVFQEARVTWLATLAVETAMKENVQDISLYDAKNNRTIKINKFNIDENIQLQEFESIERFELIKDKLFLYRKQTNTECIIDIATNPPDLKINVDDVYGINLPKIDENKELYMMGKIPLWLLASISRSYQNNEKYCCQMGKGGQFYTKIASEDKEKLGTTKADMDTMKIKEFLTYMAKDMEGIAQISKQKETIEQR